MATLKNNGILWYYRALSATIDRLAGNGKVRTWCSRLEELGVHVSYINWESCSFYRTDWTQ